MADVPGLGFTGSPGVQRNRLPLHDASAVTRKEQTWREMGFDMEALASRHRDVDAERFSLVWHDRAGRELNTSPVRLHQDRMAEDESRPSVTARTWEYLELPGEPMDYHFALMAAVDELWSRRQKPEALADVEVFARLDVMLCVTRPAMLWNISETTGERFSARVTSADRLLRILELAGEWRDALTIAEQLVAALDQQEARRDTYVARVADLDAELSA